MRRPVALGVLQTVLLATVVVAQQQPEHAGPEQVGEEHVARWVVRSSAAADLWFHGMALIGLDDPEAPLPLYSRDYAREVARIRADRGISTLLDTLAAELREEFEDASTLDFLHFVPLYFPRAGPEEMLRALRVVAQRKAPDSTLRRRELRFGMGMVAAATQRKNERRFLDRLVDALEDEWSGFFEKYRESRRQDDSAVVAEIQEIWDSTLVPGLEPFLTGARLRGGVILVSPALGPEGRLVPSNAMDGTGHVVAVWMPAGRSESDAGAFSALKEMCFTIIDEVVDASDDDDAVQTARARAAVRCGALLLEFHAPTLAARYRRSFLKIGGNADVRPTIGAFESMYELEPEVFEALRQAIRRRR